MADEIVVMSEGRIVERGAPADLYRHPATRFTADFLGLTNVIPLTVRGGLADLPWGDRRPVPGASDGRVAVAIRPEDLTLTADPEGRAIVETAVFLGAAIHYTFACGGRELSVGRARRASRGSGARHAGARGGAGGAAPARRNRRRRGCRCRLRPAHPSGCLRFSCFPGVGYLLATFGLPAACASSGAVFATGGKPAGRRARHLHPR